MDPVLPRIDRPDQGLLTCYACQAMNLPRSVYCCWCGLPLAGGPLDPATRAEVEQLVDSAGPGPATPVVVVEGQGFQSRCLEVTFSVWPAVLASPDQITDLWQGLAVHAGARVLLCAKLDVSTRQLVPLLESVAAERKPLVIVTGLIGSDALATLVVNHVQQKLPNAVLTLTPPEQTHGVLLADLARVLQTNVVVLEKLERQKAANLPLVKEIFAGTRQSLASLSAYTDIPHLPGTPELSALRRQIYGVPGKRIEIGANSRAGIQTRVRYASQYLQALLDGKAATSSAIPPSAGSGISDRR